MVLVEGHDPSILAAADFEQYFYTGLSLYLQLNGQVVDAHACY
jgi:hypothetical protein